jgi:hypothetical protein
MNEELKEIEKNRAWELVNKSDKKEVDVKWIYKLKIRPNGELLIKQDW